MQKGLCTRALITFQANSAQALTNMHLYGSLIVSLACGHNHKLAWRVACNCETLYCSLHTCGLDGWPLVSEKSYHSNCKDNLQQCTCPLETHCAIAAQMNTFLQAKFQIVQANYIKQ